MLRRFNYPENTKQDIGYAQLAGLRPQYGLCKFVFVLVVHLAVPYSAV